MQDKTAINPNDTIYIKYNSSIFVKAKVLKVFDKSVVKHYLVEIALGEKKKIFTIKEDSVHPYIPEDIISD